MAGRNRRPAQMLARPAVDGLPSQTRETGAERALQWPTAPHFPPLARLEEKRLSQLSHPTLLKAHAARDSHVARQQQAVHLAADVPHVLLLKAAHTKGEGRRGCKERVTKRGQY